MPGTVWWCPSFRPRYPARAWLVLLAVLGVFTAPPALYVWRWDAHLVAYSGGLSGMDRSYVGATYNVGVVLEVKGRGTVRIVSARARHVDPGLRQLSTIVGFACDWEQVFPIGVVGADLSRDPEFAVTTPERARLRGPTDCAYLVLRFVPERLGALVARDGEVVYVVNGDRRVARFEFATRFDVTRTGHDSRDVSPVAS